MARKRKRKHVPEARTTVKLPDDVKKIVDHIQTVAGWSYAITLAFLSRAGTDALFNAGKSMDALRDVLNAAIAKHDADKVAASMLAERNAQLREAQKALAQSALPPDRLPERALGRGLGAVIHKKSGKTGRGRKRRSPVPPENGPERGRQATIGGEEGSGEGSTSQNVSDAA